MAKRCLTVGPSFHSILLAFSDINYSKGLLDSLKHLKKEISEARKGTECGLSIANFGGAMEGDLIQCYEIIEKPGAL
jgi:translation initiation factor IF-2